MNRKPLLSGLIPVVFFGSLFLLCRTNSQAAAAAQTGWTGASNALWSNAGNWTNGVPNTSTNFTGQKARVLNFGSLGNAQPLSTNDINAVSLNQIFFNSGATNYFLRLYPGTNASTLFDFSGAVPKIENDSTNLQTVDMPFTLSGNAGGGAGEIDPSSGDIFLTTNATVSLATNTQFRFFGSAGHMVTLNASIFGGATNSCALMGSASAGAKGPFVIFANTNSCTNIIINAGTARLAAAYVTTNLILLGDTNTTTTAPATLQLDNGFANASPLVVQAGSANSRTIGNTAFGSGTADFTGPISLGTNLTILANAAGTLEFDGNVDFQNPNGVPPRTLTISGTGNTLFTGSFTNATTGISGLVKTNSGTLTLLGTNNANRILFNLGGGVISITNGSAIGIPAGVSYPDKFNFTASATLSVINSFTLGRNVSGSDFAGFRIAGGNTGTFDVAAGSVLTIDGPIIDLPSSGSGSLAKTNAGTLILQQPDTYSGTTAISSGVLALAGNGSIGNTANIIIGAGAVFDVSGLASGFTLGSSQTLTAAGATGIINSNVNLGSGSLVINYTNGTPTLQITNGTFTLNNNAVTITVQGTALPAGTYKLVSAGMGGIVAGSVGGSVVTVNGAGFSSGAQTTLTITGGELYLVVNHAPVATPLTLTRYSGINSLKIALADLATNWSDADGNPVSFVSVGASTNGVLVATNGGYVLYDNANNVSDQFSYTIADSLGATATGVVNIVISGNSVFGQTSPSINTTGGSPTVNFAGIPGYSYSVQSSTNLSTWIVIWTTNAPVTGIFQFTDTSAPQPAVYYRLQWNP